MIRNQSFLTLSASVPVDTSTTAPACEKNGVSYEHYEFIPMESDCVDCYCLSGEIVCATQECVPPATNCVPIKQPKGSCCPTQYECCK